MLLRSYTLGTYTYVFTNGIILLSYKILNSIKQPTRRISSQRDTRINVWENFLTRFDYYRQRCCRHFPKAYVIVYVYSTRGVIVSVLVVLPKPIPNYPILDLPFPLDFAPLIVHLRCSLLCGLLVFHLFYTLRSDSANTKYQS